MAVTTTTSRASYAGDGTTTVFPVPFYFLTNPDLNVYVGGTELTTGYTVTGAGNEAGGSVEIIPAPAAGAQVVIVRNPDLLQQTRLPPNDPFPAQAVEGMSDKLTMIVQRNGDQIGRALVLADTDVDGSGAYRANQNRVQDVGDPVLSQDAVNLRTMQEAIASFVNTGGGDSVMALLANSADSTLGVSLVGGAGRFVSSVAAARQVDATKNARVIVDSHEGDLAGEPIYYRYDPNDTTSADTNGPVIIGASSKRLKAAIGPIVSPSLFAIVGDGRDVTQNMLDMNAWVASLGRKVEIGFGPGQYTYSQAPNWNIPHLALRGRGECILNYTGTGSALLFDVYNASDPNNSGWCYGVRASGFIIDAPNALTGVWQRNHVHMLLEDIKIKTLATAAGGSSAINRGCGFRIFGGIINSYRDLDCSINTFPGTSKPYYGLYLDDSSANGTRVSTNGAYYGARMEGLYVGISLAAAQNNTFVSGTSEGNSVYGVADAGVSSNNSFIGMGLEANGVEDMYITGGGNSIINCYSSKRLHFLAGTKPFCNTVFGGQHENVLIDPGVVGTDLRNFTVNWAAGGGGTITDNGSRTTILNVWDDFNSRFLQDKIGTISNRSAPRQVVTVGGSPLVWQNNNLYPVLLHVSGGTITSIQVSNDGVTFDTAMGTGSGQQVVVPSGYYAKVTFSVAPSVTAVPF